MPSCRDNPSNQKAKTGEGRDMTQRESEESEREREREKGRTHNGGIIMMCRLKIEIQPHPRLFSTSQSCN